MPENGHPDRENDQETCGPKAVLKGVETTVEIKRKAPKPSRIGAFSSPRGISRGNGLLIHFASMDRAAVSAPSGYSTPFGIGLQRAGVPF